MTDYLCPDCKKPLVFGVDKKGDPQARCEDCNNIFIVTWRNGKMHLFGSVLPKEDE